MGIIRNTASARRVGKVGNEAYYVSKGQQIVRVAQNDSNYGATASRTISQQANRVKWANLVNFYKLSTMWMPKAFETRKGNQSDYNRFMQVNKPNARINLTKDAALNGAVVVDSFVISQGSLPSIQVQQEGEAYKTNIALGTLVITADTTVAEFSAAVVAANNWMRYNMQISFVSYQQSTNALGYPIAVCTAYEVTLAADDTRALRDLLPEFCSQSTGDHYLATNNNISVGGFAYILSETIGGKTKVSTQLLVTKNEELIAFYSSRLMLLDAVQSYGVTNDAFLDSGSEETTPTPAEQFIESVFVDYDGTTHYPNEGIFNAVVTKNNGFDIKFANNFEEGLAVESVIVYGRDNTYQMTVSSISRETRTIWTVFGFDAPDDDVSSIDVNTNKGTYTIIFGVIPE